MKIHLDSAIHLLHENTQAVLATHSTNVPGYPYATAVPLVVDEHQQPFLLISALAEHTKNLLADPRASLAVVDSTEANVQNAARLTLVGDFQRVSPTPGVLARYSRYLPEADQYLQLDFMFFRMIVQRARFIAGVGKMGWMEGAAWQGTTLIDPMDEAQLLAHAEPDLPSGVKLIGIDAYGVDYLVDKTRKRLHFEKAFTAVELSKCLPALLQAIRL